MTEPEDAGAVTPRRRGWLIATAVGALTASAVYIATTAIGGAIVPGYSPVEDSVSSLTSPGSPFREGLGVGYAVYNAAVAVMAAGLLVTSRRDGKVRLASTLLIIGSVAGVLMVEPFPQDPMGEPLTPAGTGHLVLAGVAALGLVAAAVLYGIAWRNDPLWHRIATLSVIAGIVVFVTGGIAAAFIASPIFGLLERTTQLAFLAWFAVIGVVAVRTLRQSAATPGPAQLAGSKPNSRSS
jgi:hypothetical protein